MLERPWLSDTASAREAEIKSTIAQSTPDDVEARLNDIIDENRRIHERDCVNLNPATNTMNPKAEALLSQGLGARPSLGDPGEKYEMGLEAIEQIEVMTASLACEVFDASFAEIRVGSGALANLYAYMATCKPGDAIIVPSATVGGHVTHHNAGTAGLYGLEIHEAPVDPERYTVDVAGVAELAARVRPKLITIGQSLNLLPHPVAELREIADSVGAHLLFDAAHACGMIAGRQWPNPLAAGAHLMTMSTYKSLGGPAGGLVVTNDAALAERLAEIAFPGLTANFDVSKSAALAMSLLDWTTHGVAYAAEMVSTSRALAGALMSEGVPVFTVGGEATESYQFALDMSGDAGGHAAAEHLRRANLLTCAIGLPHGAEHGLRFGTPEMVRWGMTGADTAELADLISRALGDDPEAVAGEVIRFRRRFTDLHFVRV